MKEYAMRRALRWAWLLAFTVTPLGGCSSPAQEPATVQQSAAAQQQDESTLTTALAKVGGAYEWNEELKRFVFSDKPAIDKLVEPATDATIRDLVQCLDDKTPSATTLKDEHVAVGVLCHEALGLIVYYEAAAPNGAPDANWPGYVEPTATAEELAAAKRAWSEVVERRAYKRL
jgi:hypothetical protein